MVKRKKLIAGRILSGDADGDDILRESKTVTAKVKYRDDVRQRKLC